MHMFYLNNQLLDEANYRFVVQPVTPWAERKPYPYRRMDELTWMFLPKSAYRF